MSDIAKGIGKVAKKAGIHKIQILPFRSMEGRATAEGRMLASRLMSAIVDRGEVMVVEGDLPEGIADPYEEAMGSRKAVGRTEAEAVVIGYHQVSDRRVHLDVRLLRIRDRVVLYSGGRDVKNEWKDAVSMEDIHPSPASPAPILAAAGPLSLGSQDPSAAELTRESAADDDDPDCSNAAEEVDRLQRSIMDIKARYVARKLRDEGRALSDKPPTLIDDQELQNEFDLALAHYLESSSIPPLSPREMRALVIVDGKSFEIHNRCAPRRS